MGSPVERSCPRLRQVGARCDIFAIDPTAPRITVSSVKRSQSIHDPRHWYPMPETFP